MSITQPNSPWPALHGGVFLLAWGLIPTFLNARQWPWFLLLPLATYVCIALLVPSMRRTIPWPSAGRVDALGVLAAVVLSVLTAAVLLDFQSRLHPDVTALADALPVSAFGNVVLAGVCFSICNAALEELVFRGLLYAVVAAEWGNAVAVGVTALCFGIGHLHGYPPGHLGVLLAGLYGVALGLLRWWSGGLCLTIACHATADATIFSSLASAGAFPQ
jgi:uncharacterized protein